MKITCFNANFTALPQSFVGRELPRFLGEYTISDQMVDNGVVWVELEEIPGLMFDMEKHFMLIEESELM